MALRFFDSCGDHYATITQKWNSANCAIGSAGGRFGTNGITLSSADVVGAPLLTKTLDSQTGWTIGFSYRKSTVGVGQTEVRMLDGGTTHLFMHAQTDASLQLYRGDSTYLGGTTAGYVVAGSTYYIEIKFTIHDTTGILELRINNNVIFSLTNQDTRNGGNASVNGFSWGTGLGSGDDRYYIDDVYLCDNTGGTPYDTFLGDSRVQVLMPSGNGNSSQLLGNDGNSTDNYLLVDETTPNSDTDYVESAVVGQKDTYAYGNLTPTSGTVHAVQPCMFARKTDAGVRSIASIARHSGSEVDSANAALGTSFAYYTDIRTTKPGGGAWSVSDVNGAEFGMKVTA